MSRPTKLTPAVEALILEALRTGHTRTAAAEHVGVPRERLSRWMARNVTFRHAVLRAEAEAEIAAATSLREAFEAGDWRAGFAWLERRRHHDWGRIDRVEIEVRRAAERIAESYPPDNRPDPDWLVRRAAEIAARAESKAADG
jgi:hypothetical protein